MQATVKLNPYEKQRNAPAPGRNPYELASLESNDYLLKSPTIIHNENTPPPCEIH